MCEIKKTIMRDDVCEDGVLEYSREQKLESRKICQEFHTYSWRDWKGVEELDNCR